MRPACNVQNLRCPIERKIGGMRAKTDGDAPSPALSELQYVNDLQFVQDPGPAEPVWSAD
jgi:hypothetical protein